ncbi:MAG: DUF4416 family protein [Thermodesulfobacteriaceae bacterium]|nr:DUF4416 family protein [Thermodesulfobacteriaceae bacterium]MCX8042335.1 DUF4416 family protein [Thermodesulfobacteriaceae bacterium]MDW8136713.1 DUF4416 family protein [Thermodesulfobacterium sp.]
MAHPKHPPPYLYFLAITAKDLSSIFSIFSFLERDLGKICHQSSEYEFSKFTSYYTKEMGEPLKKALYFFENLKPAEYLLELKYKCYDIEKSTASPSGFRTVNLDPGYLGLVKVVLSTFKDYAHRIYLGKGVFAEITLIYKDKSFRELPWTYPDYKQPEVIETFNRVREIYRKKLQCLSTPTEEL